MASRDPGFQGLKAPQFLGPRDTGPKGHMVPGSQRTETIDNHSVFFVFMIEDVIGKSWHLLTERKP